MEGFWKPGSSVPSGIDDRDYDGVGESDHSVSVVWNPNESLSLELQKSSLPVSSRRDEIVYSVQSHRVTIVVGATGSGKTTQIPQFMLPWLGKKKMAVSQPRRVAAMSVASRVAEEVGCSLGSTIGYSVRLEQCVDHEKTRVIFLTDGVLVREMLDDPLLSQYSVVMIDECHERSLHTDILLALLKKLLSVRTDLRLVLSSATMETDLLMSYFGEEEVPHVIYIAGRSFGVDIYYLRQPCADYVMCACNTIQWLHRNMALVGDVLCFVSGKEEIEMLVDMLNTNASLVAVALHASLSVEDQLKALQPLSGSVRKVIVATNVAETSITVPGVRYVVDCGFQKQRWFNATLGMEMLSVVPISKSSADQRAGRAGRVMPGKCFRLYTQETYLNALSSNTPPEIQRVDLTPVVLQLKMMHIDDLVHFDYLSPPPAKSLARSLELLLSLGAIDETTTRLTPVGSALAELPVAPQIARMLVASAELGCSEQVVSIAAMLSVQNVFVSPKGQTKATDAARRSFAVAEGDHISLLNVYNSFVAQKKSTKWCKHYFINHRILSRACSVRDQIRGHMIRLGLPMRSSDNLENIRKCVVYGFFANAAQVQPDGTYQSVRGGPLLHVHPNSCFFRGTKPHWLVYGQLTFTSKAFISENTPVSPDWLLEIAPSFFQRQNAATQ